MSGARSAEGKRFLKARLPDGVRHVRGAALAGLGVTLCEILQAFAFASALHAVVVGGAAVAEASGWFVVFGSATVLKACLSYLYERLAAEGSLRIRERVRHEILDCLFLREGAAFGRDTAATISAFVEGVDKLDPYYARYYPRLLLAGLSPLVMLAVIFPINWVVGLLLLLAAPMVPLNMAVVGMGAEEASRRQIEALRRLSGYFLDRLQGLPTLRRLGAAEHELGRVAAVSGELQGRTMNVLKIAFLSSAVLEFYATFAVAIVATYVGLVLLGYLSLGIGPEGMPLRTGLFLLLLAPAYFRPLRDFAASYHDAADAVAAAEHLAPLVALPDPAPAGRARPAPTSMGKIELRGTTVAFAGGEHPVLRGVDLAIPAGRKLAVTGPSGAGKSTLLGLIAGQVSPDAGEVLIDGTPFEGLDPSSLRALTSWVGQRPYLFPGTIAENVALGRPERSRREVEEAARRARVWEFAAGLPAGLDTVIGERGVGLSGGEGQRVALARVFLKDAPLVLLDEPTAHLDAATEAEVIATIARLSTGGRTVVIATHSPALVALCDTVVRLHAGALVLVEKPQYA